MSTDKDKLKLSKSIDDCPYCGSLDSDGDYFYVEYPSVYEVVLCLSCHKKFLNKFSTEYVGEDVL